MSLTDADYIFFMSSSGHCSLDCTYCIVDPIVKHQPSLTIEDIKYLLDSVGGKSALIFSGRGDFFAGYKKGEDLLAKILERNVDVALDINGIIIHEFPLLTDAQVSKIKMINLTMHYTQIVRKNAIKIWERNAKFIIRRRKWDLFLMNMIMSPKEQEIWNEALTFFEDSIFKETGERITLIRDTLNWSLDSEDSLLALQKRFSHLVAEVRHVDFESLLNRRKEVLCPAGKEYFRVWNDGKIEGCPIIGELANLGNAKDRSFFPRKTLFHCHQPIHCDCHHILGAGKMRFPGVRDLSTVAYPLEDEKQREAQAG
jgi:MoaA/NifB/PqqE/SkfB family radical SAM enzyme